MRVVISNYRGVEIKFDTDSELFSASLDGWSEEKKSYHLVTKSVDDYLKDNSNFKPFFIRSKNKPDEKIEVTGIRKDDRFVGEKDGIKSQISEYSENEFIEWVDSDNIIFGEIRSNIEQASLLRKKNEDLLSTLNGRTLKEIKKSIIQ